MFLHNFIRLFATFGLYFAMPYIGLTGVFGSGKSSVLRTFAGLGAVTVDADRVVREITDNDDAILREIQSRFGAGVLRSDGRLDRRRLADIIFNDDLKRADLEALLHPHVFAEAERIRERACVENPKAVVIFEAPLLVETAYHRRMDGLITVTAPVEAIFRRLEGRGFSRREILARMKAQLSQDAKKEQADWIIDNSGSPEETAERVRAVYSEIVSL